MHAFSPVSYIVAVFAGALFVALLLFSLDAVLVSGFRIEGLLLFLATGLVLGFLPGLPLMLPVALGSLWLARRIKSSSAGFAALAGAIGSAIMTSPLLLAQPPISAPLFVAVFGAAGGVGGLTYFLLRRVELSWMVTANLVEPWGTSLATSRGEDAE